MATVILADRLEVVYVLSHHKEMGNGDMKRASYYEGVMWIALNDDTLDIDPDSVSEYIQVIFMSHLFGVHAFQIAKDVIKIRKGRFFKINSLRKVG